MTEEVCETRKTVKHCCRRLGGGGARIKRKPRGEKKGGNILWTGKGNEMYVL
jgi:hypothetical protein